MALVDPDLPAVASLLGTPRPQPLRAAVGIAGGEVIDARITNVSWWPAQSITVQYSVGIVGGALDGRHTFVCAVGRIPEGSMVVENSDQRVGVWRVPYDPALPGLASALDETEIVRLLADLGASSSTVSLTFRAYRPRRRAVVEVNGDAGRIFLKVLRPSKITDLHRIHRELSQTLPTPASLGVDAKLGIVALQALPGETLRQTLECPEAPLPPTEQLVAIPSALPSPTSDRTRTSSIERVPLTLSLLKAVTPELGGRLDSIAEEIGVESTLADHPSHGDYYESQVMVDRGHVAGLLDVDTFAWGRPGDDPATMLAHLTVWLGMSRSPQRVRMLGDSLVRAWDALVDPVDLRIRTAASILALAGGPFNAQSAAWPSEIADRVGLAASWLESVSKRTFNPFSSLSHTPPAHWTPTY